MAGHLTGSLTWSGLGNILLEIHVVDIRTDGTLQLQVVGNVPNGLTCEAIDIFLRCITILIQIPIGVLVILVVTVPVGVVTIAGLVVLQPSLIVGTSKGHQVLTDVALRVTQCRTVLYILMGVVGRKIKVNRTCRSIDTQIEVITTHVSIGKNVLVSHVCHREANTCFTRIHRENSCVLGGKTCAEEVGDIVLIHLERTLHAIEIFHQLIVCLGTPAHIGTRVSRLTELTAITHTINLLDIIPLCILHVEGQ